LTPSSALPTALPKSLVLFGVGPFLQFVVLHRFNFGMPASWRKERYSTYLTNFLLAATVGRAVFLIGFWKFRAHYLPTAALGASIGVGFFMCTSVRGSVLAVQRKMGLFQGRHQRQLYYALPKILQWFTRQHRIHHSTTSITSSPITGYRSAWTIIRAQRSTRSLFGKLACFRYKLWDENRGKW